MVNRTSNDNAVSSTRKLSAAQLYFFSVTRCEKHQDDTTSRVSNVCPNSPVSRALTICRHCTLYLLL
ncbi:uncharacterized protein CYBJADRAFT_170157 [Cyberlindnera jadinii NRRL Y-1542]|uniref:Uncharacterized protein n=1 Tax=Cyberlindnera jadinii (strain ATCC 18201 / CBS 1600 / BCRC 20928 / JCM 3617 / NBRC 0987 / NRRL Y-1542) TaxID=983966 RepID=A0A1E4RU31_CYBJN|nr:hypothetical protein CYBJADRAFT_170157 [Cyberlindnera jadinii NRRL Y-1542]ODV70575.1 hypothetical protein CYBJADRAFT_170157 [Cyberlindnera jadinii NRRL Y-1542]